MTLEKADRSDYARVKKLYRSAFPREERMPYHFLKWKAQQGKAKMMVAKEAEEFIGFVYLVCHEDLVYLFWFAVAGDKRGGGNGSRILQLVKQQYPGRRLFLAREQLDRTADNYEQRRKRRQFYMKNGFEDLDCRIREAGVVYDVMGIGGAVSAEEYKTLIENWRGKWLLRFADMELLASETDR